MDPVMSHDVNLLVSPLKKWRYCFWNGYNGQLQINFLTINTPIVMPLSKDIMSTKPSNWGLLDVCHAFPLAARSL